MLDEHRVVRIACAMVTAPVWIPLFVITWVLGWVLSSTHDGFISGWNNCKKGR